jgi:deoxyadenosine/deoxycytidine kinase
MVFSQKGMTVGIFSAQIGCWTYFLQINAIPTLVPDGFIYLRANPATCFNRLKKRARAEEDKVDLDYLQVRSAFPLPLWIYLAEVWIRNPVIF